MKFEKPYPVIGHLFSYVIIALVVLTIIAPFVEIPYIDRALENFGKKHPLLTGFGIMLFGLWLLIDNLKDGHSDKWIRGIDYVKGLTMLGLGFFHLFVSF